MKKFFLLTLFLFPSITMAQPKCSEPILISAIDTPYDLEHFAIQSKLWTNPKEIPDNNIDDDENGFVDDIHGWNFIGGKTEDVNEDNLELTRVYKQLSDKF